MDNNKMIELINEAENYIVHTYNRYQIVFDKGNGMYLYDVTGKKYLDFASGIAVFAFGYNNKDYNEHLKNQIDKLIHTSNYYYNKPAIMAAKKLAEASNMDKVFFTNSGTEAIEGAVKLAKKFGTLKNPLTEPEIIAMDHSFHGRSMGALSITGTKKYRDPFGALIAGVKFAKFNDIESVKALINDNTAAIIFECVQGEGGIYKADDSFVKGIRKICDENDILMICDEIQCGMGRTGKMFAYQNYDIVPDVVTTAKALGCGVPVGAFLTKGKTNEVLVPGDHGTTYGGNPFATAAVSKVLDMYKEYDILNKVNEISQYLVSKLEELVNTYDFITSYRGMGLMMGLVFNKPVAPIVKACIDSGLILISAGENVIRIIPPLIVSKEDIDEMIKILKTVL